MKTKELKVQVEALAKAHEQGIDIVSNGIQDLYLTLDHVIKQLRTQDVLLTALKYTIIKNKIVTEEELLTLVDKITEVANKELDFKAKEKPATSKPLTLEQELETIHTAAKKAAEEVYPEQCFIFGG